MNWKPCSKVDSSKYKLYTQTDCLGVISIINNLFCSNYVYRESRKLLPSCGVSSVKFIRIHRIIGGDWTIPSETQLACNTFQNSWIQEKPVILAATKYSTSMLAIDRAAGSVNWSWHSYQSNTGSVFWRQMSIFSDVFKNWGQVPSLYCTGEKIRSRWSSWNFLCQNM